MPKSAHAKVQRAQLPEPVSRETFTLPNGEKYLKLRYYKPGEERIGPTRDQTRAIAAKEKLPMIPIEEAQAIRDNDQLRTAMESNLENGDFTYVDSPKTDTRYRAACLFRGWGGGLDVNGDGYGPRDAAPMLILRMGSEAAAAKQQPNTLRRNGEGPTESELQSFRMASRAYSEMVR